jgi:MGT family glycosyltransferase
MLTGSRFESAVSARGMEFRALPAGADYDDRDHDSYLPDGDKYSGLARAQYDIQTIFIKTIPAQFTAVRAIVDEDRPDAVLVDAAFAGAGPLLLDSSAKRPPIIAVGVLPLSQSSKDVAPYGMAIPPSSTPIGRLRNRTLNLLARKVLFRDTQRAAIRAFAEIDGPPLSHFVMDISSAYDRFLQLSVAAFEYPRSDLSPNVRFVGPVGTPSTEAALPDWWADLDGARPVVHVTQGTIDNRDLERLIRPTIAALFDSDVLVIVTMGGRSANELGPVPTNVRVADYVPYDALLAVTDVFVTNGGYGGVQQALSNGVPIVVAGDTEDKPEVAARVGWSGVGINLRTGTPTAGAIRSAVHAVLADPRYRERARGIAAEMAQHDALPTIESELADAVSRARETARVDGR